MTARNIIRARVGAANACGYRYPAQARAAGDAAAVTLIDAAARVALDNLFQPNPKGTAMLIASLHAQGELDDRQAAVLALTSAGFDGPAAVALIRRLADVAVAELDLPALAALTAARGGKVRQAYTKWTPDQVAILNSALAETGGELPAAGAIRDLARATGRSVKSVTSKLERIVEGRS